MTCKECKPVFGARQSWDDPPAKLNFLHVELCPRCEAIHALTDRLAERLMSIQYAYYTAKTAELLAEYDSAKKGGDAK